MKYYRCAECGRQPEGNELENEAMFCPECGNLLEEVNPADREASPAAPPGAEQQLRFHFSGSAGEYFRIWIVNTFLTIITLGVYLAWAKVRTRKYFYANTALAGHRFDYVANPLAIFKGYCIVGTCSLIYAAVQHYNPLYSLPAMLLFFMVFPFLIYKSLCFKAHNSAYRNIRFRFSGNLWDSYKTYMFLPIFIPFTLGILFPYVSYRQKKYFFNNFAFGKMQNSFAGTHGPFYSTYFRAALSFVLFIILSSGLIAGLVYLFSPQLPGNSAAPAGSPAWAPMALAANVLVFFGVLFIHQYVFAALTNYCWQKSSMGRIRFSSTLRTFELIALLVTNFLAIIFSFGLLAPWAKIRKTRYLLDHLTILAEEGALEGCEPSVTSPVAALGDVSTDFFDIDIGL